MILSGKSPLPRLHDVMFRAGTRAISSLVDRVTSNFAISGDLSHRVDVRPLQADEIDIVASQLNPARNAATHRGRVRLQEDGVVLYLIAWIEHTPVGHGMIIWDGPTGTPRMHIDKSSPYIEDLWVRKDLRSRGIGRRMLAEMIRLAISHGRSDISLSVGTDNHRAIKLYESIGFVVADVPRFTLSGMVTMSDGQSHFWSERCQYMVKSLDFNEPQGNEIE